jgi:RNA polymerase sigma-70 factor, ECF subfamily
VSLIMESSSFAARRPSKIEPDNNRLIAAATSGDHAAFGLLVRRHQRQAFAVAYRLLGNQQDALDVTQDAFVKAYKNLATLRSPVAFSGWLLRIVSNLSLNFRRSRKTRQRQSLGDVDSRGIAKTQSPAISQWMAGDHNPLGRLEHAELEEKLREALNQLPPRQQQAIVLFTIEKMPQKEVARELNCSVEAVKWHVFQGRQRLKKIMERYL